MKKNNKLVKRIVFLGIFLCFVVLSFVIASLTKESTKKWNDDSNNAYTEYDGVYIELLSREKDESDNTVFKVKWNNETGQDVLYGDRYSIERFDGNTWRSAEKTEVFYIRFGVELKPNTTVEEKYSSENYDILETGTYRLKVSFSLKNDETKRSYYTWVKFDVKNRD